MPGHRPARIAEMVHRELAQRLRMDIKDDRITTVSITNVTVTPDLSRAVVHWLPLGGGTPTTDMVEGLASAARRLRGPIGRALRLRHAPELVFEVDTHTEAAVAMTDLLSRMAHERAERENDAEEEDKS